jgi:hypothetical protein
LEYWNNGVMEEWNFEEIPKRETDESALFLG